ncbi:hypothetical protein ACTXT7_017393 [Hymenolepis weldensis]
MPCTLLTNSGVLSECVSRALMMQFSLARGGQFICIVIIQHLLSNVGKERNPFGFARKAISTLTPSPQQPPRTFPQTFIYLNFLNQLPLSFFSPPQSSNISVVHLIFRPSDLD